MTAPSVQRSHDKPRIEPVRRRDLRAVPNAGDAGPQTGAKRPYRRSTTALLSSLTAAQRGAHGPEAAKQATEVLRVFRGSQRELGAIGAARSPSVLAHLLAFAEQRVASQRLSMLAAAAGLDADRGIKLLGESQRAQGRAERAWTAAVLAAGLLRGRGPDPGAQPVPWVEPPPEP